jgi:predicted membrane protein
MDNLITFLIICIQIAFWIVIIKLFIKYIAKPYKEKKQQEIIKLKLENEKQSLENQKIRNEINKR